MLLEVEMGDEETGLSRATKAMKVQETRKINIQSSPESPQQGFAAGKSKSTLPESPQKGFAAGKSQSSALLKTSEDQEDDDEEEIEYGHGRLRWTLHVSVVRHHRSGERSLPNCIAVPSDDVSM